MSPPSESPLELGVIGNCQVSALADELGRLKWDARQDRFTESFDRRSLGAIRLNKPWEVAF